MAAAEPCRRVVGVVLLRLAMEEVQLRIPEVAEEAHLDLPVEGAHQPSHCRVWGQRYCFCVALGVGEVAAVFPAAWPHRQPTGQEPIQLQRMSGRSAGRWPLRLKTAR